MAVDRFDDGGSGGTTDDEDVTDEEIVRQAKRQQREAESDADGAADTVETDGLSLSDLGLAPSRPTGPTTGGDGGSGGFGGGGSGGTSTSPDAPSADDLSPTDFGADPDRTTTPTRTGGGGPELTDAQQQNVDASVADVNDRVSNEQQGVERRGGAVGQQARRLEKQVLEENDGLTTDDVRVVRDGRTIRTELTPQGAERVGANPTNLEVRRRVARENPGVEADDLVVDERGDNTFDVSLADPPEERQERGGGTGPSRFLSGLRVDIEPGPRSQDIFSTDVLGTTGTRTGRLRARTPRASSSQSLSTTGLGADDEVGISVGDLDRELQQEVNKSLIESRSRQLSRFTRRRERQRARQESDFSRATDVDFLTSEDSAGSKFFGTEEREQAIEEEALDGSFSARTFLGAEAIEQAGVEASKALEEAVPQRLFGANVSERVGVGGVDVNPRVGIGANFDLQQAAESGAIDAEVFVPEDSPRVGEQLRNVAVGAPAGLGVVGGFGGKAAGDVGLRVERALGADVDDRALISGGATTAATAGGVRTVGRGVFEEPVGALAEVALPTAAARFSPIRTARFDVPEAGGTTVSVSRSRRLGAGLELARRGESPLDARNLDLETVERVSTTTTEGLRLEAPAVVQKFTSRNLRGRTLVGRAGKRPSLGAPDVDLRNVDIERLGGDKANQGGVFEPSSQFETEVIEGSAGRISDEAGDRVTAARDLVEAGESRTGSATTREVEDLEGAVADVEGVPEEAAPAVIDALAEADATIFGSGAVRAQAPDFRAPGDLDIVVPDKSAAKGVLQEMLADTDVDVGRTFDIKEADDFAGLEKGEVFGFGARSQSPILTPEGVRINPIGEELQRKAGASGFIRDEGAGGTDEIDVGPRDNPGGVPREKDVDDAIGIGEELLGEDSRTVQQFAAVFDRRPPVTPRSGTAFDRDVFGVGQRAQVDFGGRKSTRRVDADDTRGRRREEPEIEELDQEIVDVERLDPLESRVRSESPDSRATSRVTPDRSPAPSTSPSRVTDLDPSVGSVSVSPGGNSPSTDPSASVQSPSNPSSSPSVSPSGATSPSPNGSPSFGSPSFGSPSASLETSLDIESPSFSSSIGSDPSPSSSLIITTGGSPGGGPPGGGGPSGGPRGADIELLFNQDVNKPEFVDPIDNSLQINPVTAPDELDESLQVELDD